MHKKLHLEAPKVHIFREVSLHCESISIKLFLHLQIQTFSIWCDAVKLGRALSGLSTCQSLCCPTGMLQGDAEGDQKGN